MEEGGDQPWSPIIQDQYSSRREEMREGEERHSKIKPLS